MAEEMVSGSGGTMAEYDHKAKRSGLDLRRQRMLVCAGLKQDVGLFKAGTQQPLMVKNEIITTTVSREDSENPQIKEEEEELCIQQDMAGVIAVTVKREEVEENPRFSQNYQCHTVENTQEFGGPEQRCLIMLKNKSLITQPREEQKLLMSEEAACSTNVNQEKSECPLIKEDGKLCIKQEAADIVAVVVKTEEVEERLAPKHRYQSHTVDNRVDSGIPGPAGNLSPSEQFGPCFEDESANSSETEDSADEWHGTNEPQRLKTLINTTLSNDMNGSNVEDCSCSYCGKRFTKKSSMKRHEKLHTGEKPFSCLVCGKKFIREYEMRAHEKIHTGEKPFSCSECGKKFIKKSDLKRHEKNHTGEKPFSCSECEKKFVYEYEMKTHEKIHTGEKPFICLQCGKSFSEKKRLKSHEKKHSGEKPFNCSECGKCFVQKSDLTRHEKIHTGEKPFSCSECGKRFFYECEMRSHEKIHTGEKLFICPECGMRFTEKKRLRSHEKVHTGVKPFSCSDCGRKFTRGSSLRRHEKIHTIQSPVS